MEDIDFGRMVEAFKMQITRRSEFSGIIRTMEIPITSEQLRASETGVLIQIAMPDLTPSEREFILTGITDEEWHELFSDDDEDFE